jgi:two-component system OmpR family sensor kinase
MLDSVRSRLALWHTVVLAVLLIGFATATDLWMGRAISRREDRFLEESTNALRANVAAELAEAPLDTAVAQSLAEFRLRHVVFLIVDASGRLIARSAARADGGDGARRQARTAGQLDTVLARVVGLRARARGRERFVTVGEGDDAQRLFVLPAAIGQTRFTIIAAESLAEQQELLEDTRAGFLIAIPLGLLLAWLGGLALARRSLAPVTTMSGRAAAIGASSLHERLPVGNPRDELGQLATVFNDLLARLDAAFDQQRRFMADAAHELRTPVSIMRGEADIALSQRERSSEEYRGALEVVRAEGRRLSRIVGELFLLARADAGQQPLQPRAMYLDELVSDCVRAVRSLAIGRAVTVRCAMDPPVSTESDRPDGSAAGMDHAYQGDEELLRRLLVNLLDNAIKHAPSGSTVEVRLISDAREHRLQVIDRGAGISRAALDHVFERFFRADESRARDEASETGGAGLGLAIARWVAEAHGGTLAIVSSSPGETIFEARLPRTSAPAATSASV